MAEAFRCDVGRERTSTAAAATIARFGRIDVCVANAGGGAAHALVELPLEDWDRIVGVNLTGAPRFRACVAPWPPGTTAALVAVRRPRPSTRHRGCPPTRRQGRPGWPRPQPGDRAGAVGHPGDISPAGLDGELEDVRRSYRRRGGDRDAGLHPGRAVETPDDLGTAAALSRRPDAPLSHRRGARRRRRVLDHGAVSGGPSAADYSSPGHSEGAGMAEVRFDDVEGLMPGGRVRRVGGADRGDPGDDEPVRRADGDRQWIHVDVERANPRARSVVPWPTAS